MEKRSPVAYVHRQKSAALRAKTKQPEQALGLRPQARGNSQTALRAVGPLSPPAPYSPVKARGRRGAKRLVGEFFIGEY
jgi:hypothetical protein